MLFNIRFISSLDLLPLVLEEIYYNKEKDKGEPSIKIMVVTSFLQQ